MICPNIRASFGRPEAELLLSLIGPRGEALLREQGLDALLDDAEILRALVRGGGIRTTPAPLFFYLLVRHALLQQELADRRMADYVAAVLLEFGMVGRSDRTDAGEGESFHYLADVLAALEQARGEREARLRVHLGNLALWLSGVFPDHITHRVHRRGAPPLSYYEEMGMLGFRSAAGSELALRHGVGDVLLHVAERFRDVRVALNGLSDALFFPRAGDPTDRLLRQVADGFDRSTRLG